MTIYTQYSYPSRDILTTSWSGVSDNITKYTNLDEGVSSPNYNDYICKSGLMSEINGRHSFQFGTNALHVLPSSVFLNINVNASSSNILSTGNLWLERALLLDSNSGVIAQYDYKSAGEPTYSWPLSSDFSTKNVILSGFTTNSTYFNYTTCDIRLSGNFSAFVELSDKFKVSISAFEFLSSGVVGVEFSGMPLFITGPRLFSECLTVINVSGAPISNTPSGFWFDKFGNRPEDDQNWWRAISGGVHNPEDVTYINGSVQTFYEHPTGLSGLGPNLPAWTSVNGTPASLVANSTQSIPSINSGVLTPFDTSYFSYSPTPDDLDYYIGSPEILFNRPANFSKDIAVVFRAEKFNTDDTMLIRNMVLKNNAGTTLTTWPDSEINIGSLANYRSSHRNVNNSLWTQINNYLTFDIYQHYSGIIPSGTAKFYEIDLRGDGLSLTSPNIYFKQPTLNNANAGVSACFRINYNGGAPSSILELSDITWQAENYIPANFTISTFPNMSITDIPQSSYKNYCVMAQGSPAQIATFDNHKFNFMKFTSTVPSGHQLSDFLFSELEICCSGLDPVESGYIPLFINANLSDSSGISLYEYGYASANSGMSLYEYGHDSKNSGIPLYLNGNDSSNSGIPLYIAGPIPVNSGLALSIWGHSTSSSGLSLYIAGPIPQSSWMPLFLKAETIPGANGSVPLFTYSTSNSGLFKTLPLYIGGSGDTNTSMPLYLMGPEHADVTSNMILFLKGIGNLDGSTTVSSGIPMFLKNGWVAQNSGINLYLKTQEGTLGAVPVSSWMPLFINREFNSTANNVPLYLKVADVGSGNIPMYVKGTYVMESGIPLIISNVYTSSTLSLPMYTHAH